MSVQLRISLPCDGRSPSPPKSQPPLRRQFRRHDRIVDSTHPSSLTVIEEGWACRCRITHDGRRQILGIMIPGDSCGAAATTPAWVNFSIVALSAVTVAMRLFEYERPSAILEHALADAALSVRWIARLNERSAAQRVADFVDEMVTRQGLADLADHIPSAPFLLTQYDLADATGLTAIHVNRTLRELKATDLLRIRRGEIEIPSVLRLRAVAAGSA